jgi:hypothetical protein
LKVRLVSEGYVTSIFRVEKYVKQGTTAKQETSIHIHFLFLMFASSCMRITKSTNFTVNAAIIY